jgi:EAL domain-containing protein (putative c-di-GMP-specific phosphodiesterase class I)
MGKTIASRLACATVTLALVAAIGAGGSWGASRPEASAGADGYSIGSTTLYTGAQAWWDAGYTGRGVDVAVIDSGVAPVAGLDAPGKVVQGPDLSLESQSPNLTRLDTFGHGTFMAGLIAAAGGGYRGMAPGARIVSLKVATADGGADVSQVIAAIDWVVQHAHDPGLNIRVLNLSYGTNSRQSYLVDPLAYAAEQAWKKGRRILRQACRDLALWQKNHRGQGDLSVTVNLSPSELQNPKVAEEVAQILAETRIPPRSLTLEITESGAMRDQEATIETLHVLRGLGVRLALDDFGTGYSSLSHLREFPIDILKIAKPFVEDLGAGTSDPAFLEAILGLARALDLTVIVEGIETADQAETLHRLGCRIGQGYHFARPLDRTAAAAHLGVRPLAAA